MHDVYITCVCVCAHVCVYMYVPIYLCVRVGGLRIDGNPVSLMPSDSDVQMCVFMCMYMCMGMRTYVYAAYVA
jgi:hypothetical protein